MLTQEELKALIHYDPKTGICTWIYHPSDFCQHLIGEVVGSLDKSGYTRVTLFSKRYMLHRLAWLYVHGSMPTANIDHINHNKADNSIGNLRLVTSTQNNQNRALGSINTSGFTGVYWDKSRNHWKVRIGHKGKKIFIGSFLKKEDAIAARKKANIEYGYHENHGKRFD